MNDVNLTFDFLDYESPELISWSGSIAQDPSDKHTFVITGEVGYYGDKTEVSFDYCTDTNSIWINSRYRYVFSTNTELMKLCCMCGRPYVNLQEKQCLPYFRFPRSKDGIEIPVLIAGIFKAFQDPAIKEKPHIMIPLELEKK
jgi:hypothetical protein